MYLPRYLIDIRAAELKIAEHANSSPTQHGRPSPDRNIESQSKPTEAPSDAHGNNPSTSPGMDEGDLAKQLAELEQAEVEDGSGMTAATPDRVPVDDSEEEQLKRLQAELAM